ncbi:MAG: hypothetical protein N0E59_19000, partial [Candidatus Thiodiazotropha taylori]|nr:hypothetical protein [Candidatus Thiodiazotropha taylori]MCW4285207.1 hypothetical protein [Candidatus Thiodiazotropha taylori]
MSQTQKTAYQTKLSQFFKQSQSSNKLSSDIHDEPKTLKPAPTRSIPGKDMVEAGLDTLSGLPVLVCGSVSALRGSIMQPIFF